MAGTIHVLRWMKDHLLIRENMNTFTVIKGWGDVKSVL
jgi:hypothetical protein